MASNVTFELPTKTLGKSPVEFVVKINDEKFGTLRVSQGAVRWTPKGAKAPIKKRWVKFDALMKGEGK